MLKFFGSILLIALSVNCLAQSYWRIQNENGEELLLTISINPEDMTFEAHTRRDALKEMAGSIAYTLAKTAGKLRYPEIVHSEGKVSYKADTIFYNGSFDYLDKSFPLKAKSWNNSFSGVLTDNRNRAHLLIGARAYSDKQLEDYSAIIINAFYQTEKIYWDKDLTNSDEWQTFKRKVSDVKSKISDDYELGAVLFWHSKKTFFAPFEIKRITKKENTPNAEKNYSARQVQPGVALLDLSDLPDDKSMMDKLFRDILDKNYTSLILDARGRKNLKLSTAVLLAEHLTLLPADWGVYLTRKWLDVKTDVPKSADYTKLFKSGLTFSSKNQSIYEDNGRYMKLIPAQAIFLGRIFVLTDQRTSKIPEALSIWLKNDKIATIAGQKSSGQPMLFEAVNVSSSFRITLPIAQYYDPSGKMWMGKGVEPDIPTNEDALGTVLKTLKVK
jgi:hypothetical protein